MDNQQKITTLKEVRQSLCNFAYLSITQNDVPVDMKRVLNTLDHIDFLINPPNGEQNNVEWYQT